jgi:methionine-rich copper-binding protein CopC
MRTRIFILSLLLLGSGGAGAHAHARLSSASPPVGGSVGAALQQVTLSFTQGLEPSFSSVQATDSLLISKIWTCRFAKRAASRQTHYFA